MGRTLGVLWVLSLLSLSAQDARPDGPSEAPRAQAGELGVRETVAEIMAREQARKAAGLQPKHSTRPRRSLEKLKGKVPLPQEPRAALTSPKPAPIQQPFSPQTAGTNFLAAQTSDSSPELTPLDAMGAVGPTQILVCTNGTIKVFSRTGTLGALDVSTDAFFGSVLTNGSTTDVRVRYDTLTSRWFVGCLDGDGGTVPNSYLLAVSDAASSTLTSPSSFTFFKFTAGIPAGSPPGPTQADSDGIGIDVNALYIGFNLFDATSHFVGSAALVVQKSSVLGPGPAVVTPFPGLCNAASVGVYSPQGVDNDDPAATFGYFVGVDASTTWGPATQGLTPSLTTTLYLIRIKNPGTAPAIDATFPLTVPAYGFSYGLDVTIFNPTDYGVPVKGSAKNAAGSIEGLDDLDQRLTVAQIKKGNLWTIHNIDVNASGNASFSGGRDGARWYEFTNLASATPTLAQSGTLFDPTASNPVNYFVPSLAVSGQGHMALGSTRAGPLEFADAAAAGRLAGDAGGTIQAATALTASTTSYNFDIAAGFPPGAQRWGDYTYTCVDPTDGMTMWTFQEYCNATNSMAVQVTQLKAPPPGALVSAYPSTINTGISSILVSVTASGAGGAGFFDPGAGFPNHFGAVVTAGGVTVNGVTVIDATHATLDLNTTSASVGPVIFTLTNPDGQSVSSGTILSVTAPSATAAQITQVTSSLPSATYGTGAVIPITVAFSEAVTVAGGTPTLLLSASGGPSASYTSGSGSANLIFNYTVAAGQSTSGQSLDVLNNTALVLNGATIKSGTVAAVLTVPVGFTSSPPWSLPTERQIVIDTTPPVTTITGSPPNPSNATLPVFSYASSHAGSSFQVQIDGGAWSSTGTNTSDQVGPLTDGSHTFRVRATDALGNVDPAPPSYTWTIDTVPPVTSFTTTPPNPDTQASPTVAYSANKPGCDFQLQVDGGGWLPSIASTSTALGPLGSGTHTVSVRAIDPAGNIDLTPPSYTWVINLPPAPASSGGGGHGGGCGALGWEAILIAGLLRFRRFRPASNRS